MNIKELLLECRAKNGWTSDYRLAKELDISTQRISDYMSGKREPDTYALVKVAECLKRDPLELIVQWHSEHDKDARRRDYWQGFILRASRQGARFMLALLCTLSCMTGPQQAAEEGGFRRRRMFA